MQASGQSHKVAPALGKGPTNDIRRTAGTSHTLPSDLASLDLTRTTFQGAGTGYGLPHHIFAASALSPVLEASGFQFARLQLPARQR